MVTSERTVRTRLLQRVRANAVAGLLTAYVVLLCAVTVLGPLLLTIAFDMGLVSAMKSIVGIVGVAYLIGIALLFR